MGLLVSIDEGDARSSFQISSLTQPEALADVPRVQADPVDSLLAGGRLVPNARTETYGGYLKPHALVAEASLILTEELTPFAQGVYVTSLSRAPEDQRRLMKAQRYRYWTIQRSKHLLGFAADIGFYRRRVSMRKMHAMAEQVLLERLGEEKFSRLRVVRESRCIHVELHTQSGYEEIQERTAALTSMGILAQAPDRRHPIPLLRDYVPEDEWLRRPRALLTAVAH